MVALHANPELSRKRPRRVENGLEYRSDGPKRTESGNGHPSEKKGQFFDP